MENKEIGSVTFNYVGTEKNFCDFIKGITKEYIVENNMLPDDYEQKKKPRKKSA